MSGEPRTTERVTYSDALSMLAVEDNGKRLDPQYALVKYEDGWRMFARYNGLGDAVRVTGYTIDPMEALKDG